MASRNQNWPSRIPSVMQKKWVEGTEEIGIGGEKVVAQGRVRVPLGVITNNVSVGVAVAVAEGSECSSVVDFTEEEVDALLDERMKKGIPCDTKKKMEQTMDRIKRLKQCVRWFKGKKEKLQTDLESAEKKCVDTENEMKTKIEELNEVISNLRTTILSLEEKIAKEESDKLEAIECYRKEKEARIAAEQKAIATEDLYKRSQEYNISLQQYNSQLQSNLKTVNEAHKRLETEKSCIVENLSKIRGHNMALQEQLASLRASQDEATKGKDTRRGYKGERHVS